jgi:HAD superfamily hydrolase (TIGR01549 family)
MADAVIFDIDGTLLDSVDYHARAWQETFARYGINVSFQAVRSQIGKGGDQLMPVFVPPDMLERIGKQLKDERSRHFREEYLPLVKPFPKVRELFERLVADRKRIVLALSGTRDEVEEYKRIARIADLMDADTSSDDAERSKPHPDIFLAALDRIGVIDRRAVIVVGDTPYDAEAAGKAGLRTVGVLCGGFPEADLRAAGCMAIYQGPADLLTRYKQSPLARSARDRQFLLARRRHDPGGRHLRHGDRRRLLLAEDEHRHGGHQRQNHRRDGDHHQNRSRNEFQVFSTHD